LGVVHQTTLPYSPHQNGKQEVFWAVTEGRLMAMLTSVKELALAFLNRATQAWVEMEYNRTTHSQTNEKPLDRFINEPHVKRPSPSSEALRLAFRRDVGRTQRRSDGTLMIEGVRFELPDHFRHLRQVTVRYARWDLGAVHLVDARTDALLAPLYPLDKARNADGRRRVRQPNPVAEVSPSGEAKEEVAPLLRKLIAQYAATGIPPAYVPKPASDKKDEVNE
jgi:hypothetical protein